MVLRWTSQPVVYVLAIEQRVHDAILHCVVCQKGLSKPAIMHRDWVYQVRLQCSKLMRTAEQLLRLALDEPTKAR